MKFLTPAIVYASVAAAVALPQPATPPSAFKPCGSDVNACCEFSNGQTRACKTLTERVSTYNGFMDQCATAFRLPSCCTKKDTSTMVGNVLNNMLGTTIGKVQCYIPSASLRQ
ncbi:hypothetical protein NOR_07539 [Metarhizium rileyi]|uniref:Hydrophobin n=1 Tax=Metarhizium rileyi (strain RCEF 4871) TaxID=1649241 RepID=A0A166Y2N6_METRR|nr:hypothetical protein NOR_07539 [Metarhizium rileyi RCEF 4871]TWU70825.1 hypothetical protein ED733_000522 [Metarhizium rileyi]